MQLKRGFVWLPVLLGILGLTMLGGGWYVWQTSKISTPVSSSKDESSIHSEGDTTKQVVVLSAEQARAKLIGASYSWVRDGVTCDPIPGEKNNCGGSAPAEMYGQVSREEAREATVRLDTYDAWDENGVRPLGKRFIYVFEICCTPGISGAPYTLTVDASSGEVDVWEFWDGTSLRRKPHK